MRPVARCVRDSCASGTPAQDPWERSSTLRSIGGAAFALIQVRPGALEAGQIVTRPNFEPVSCSIVAEHAADMGASIAAGPIRRRSVPFPCVSDCGTVGGHCLPTFRKGTNENLFAVD